MVVKEVELCAMVGEKSNDGFFPVLANARLRPGEKSNE